MIEPLAPEKSLHFVRLDPAFGIAVDYGPAPHRPVTLALVIQDHEAVGRALDEGQHGTNLFIGMDEASAVEIFSAIRKLARERGWQLPAD